MNAATTRSSVSHLQDLIRTTLAPLVAGQKSCALLDFPDHSNVGDSAIWVGATRWLADAGVRIGYRCEPETYNPRHLERAVPSGPIVINGGGNFGDIWKRHQRLRESVIRDFPDRPVIQLPQTIHFQNAENLQKARQLFDAHPNLTLVVRDQLSLELARRAFRAPALLCPDMAFYLGPLERGAPDTGVLWLRRNDREAVGADIRTPPDVVVTDWLEDRVPPLRRVRRILRPLAAREPRAVRLARRALAAAYDAQARSELRRGCRLLARGRVVITDRLHAHILCVLLGIPHVVLDNNYGKVRRVHDAWTAGDPLTHWASSPAEAIAFARSLEAA